MQSSCKDLSISAELKTYITFLKNNRLSQVINDTIRLSKDYQLPFLKQLTNQPPDVIHKLFHIFINEFIEDVLTENPIQGVVKLLLEWKDKKIASEITSFTLDDIVSTYLIRKQVLISYIHDYSSDPLIYINLVQELNNIVCLVEQEAINSLALKK